MNAPPRTDLPWALGTVRLRDVALPYPVSRRDMERDTDWAAKMLAWMGVTRADTIHVIGQSGDWVQLWPYECGAMRLGVPFGMAEPTSWDAYRTDMFLRRFRLAAVIGVNVETLDGLRALGRDLEASFTQATAIVAFPDAAARLEAVGLRPWRMITVGPFFAIESPERDGARLDNTEWAARAHNGFIHITTHAKRLARFVRLNTGLRGSVDLVKTDTDSEHRIFLA